MLASSKFMNQQKTKYNASYRCWHLWKSEVQRGGGGGGTEIIQINGHAQHTRSIALRFSFLMTV